MRLMLNVKVRKPSPGRGGVNTRQRTAKHTAAAVSREIQTGTRPGQCEMTRSLPRPDEAQAALESQASRQNAQICQGCRKRLEKYPRRPAADWAFTSEQGRQIGYTFPIWC